MILQDQELQKIYGGSAKTFLKYLAYSITRMLAQTFRFPKIYYR